jgi:hypothetical protein
VFHGEEDLEVLDNLLHRLDVHAPPSHRGLTMSGAI